MNVFFNPITIGQSLKEVAVDIIQTESQDVVSRWFHSEKDADLFIWLDRDGRILKQQISFCGQVAEWNIVEGVRTGFVLLDETRPNTSGSEIIRFDPKPIKAAIMQAVEVLFSVTELKDKERQVLIENFRKPTAKSDSISHGELFQRYSRPRNHPKFYFFFKSVQRTLKKLFR